MLRKRLLSAFVIVPVILAAIFYLPSAGMLIVLIGISTSALFEFYNMLESAKIPAFRFVGALCGAALMLATYSGFRLSAAGGTIGNAERAAEWEGFVLVCTVLVLMVRQFPQKHNDKPLATIACTLLGVLYVPFLLNFFTKLGLVFSNMSWQTPLAGQTGCYLILYVVVVAKLTDTGAFFTGGILGKHKLFPRISPAKTWEGLAGGILAGVLTSCLFLWLTKGKLGVVTVSMFHAVILGILLAAAGTIGDLAESLLKRAAATKDSGSIVPGIGGILDIFDSILFAVPVMYLYLGVVL